MDRNEVDRSVICTQTAKAGSSDLFAMMPWVARLNPKTERPTCEGHRYGANKACKAKATLIYVDLQNKPHYLCGAHAHTDFISSWAPVQGMPEGKRVQQFFDKHVDWTDKAKAEIEAYNREHGYE